MELKEIIQNYFKEIDWNIEPKQLYTPISYALESGGKRLRPMLTLMATKLFGGDINKAMPAAVALEIFHNFTLLHDDIMDRADMRRNRPTVHVKWDDNTAILSGDAMLIKAYQYLSKTETDKKEEILDLFTTTALQVCEGQQYDANFETRTDVTIEEYYHMIYLKTAVLLACALKMGAILGGASKEDANNLYEFGINIGIAFQLRDDYLDCYGDESTFGKKIGGDIMCGKRTFLLIQTLKNCGVSQRLTITQLLDNNSIHEREKVSTIIDIYNQLDMPKRCNEAINHYYKLSLESLDKINKSEEEKAPFVLLAKELMGRND